MDLYPLPAALTFVIRRIVSGVIEHTVLSLHCRRVRMCEDVIVNPGGFLAGNGNRGEAAGEVDKFV